MLGAGAKSAAKPKVAKAQQEAAPKLDAKPDGSVEDTKGAAPPEEQVDPATRVKALMSSAEAALAKGTPSPRELCTLCTSI